MSKIYFNQLDNRWANKMYSSVNNANQTIGSSGCGPTSSSMIVSSLTSNIVYPDNIADYYVKNGFRSANNGTYWSAFPDTAKKYGIKYNQTSDINIAIDCVKNGGMVIASTSGGSQGLFSTNGHFVVLAYFNENMFTIYDAYLYNGKYDLWFRKDRAKVNGINVFVNTEEVRKEIQQYFCFYSNVIQETKAKYVNVNSALNVREAPDLNAKVIATLKNNTLVTVYEEIDKWSKIGTNKWCYSEYLKDNSSSQNINKVMTVNSQIGLNVRKEPSTTSSIVTAYKNGTRVTIYEITNGWARGVKGWMYSKYLK